MSNEQAIAKLNAIYGNVEMVRDGVFVSKKGSNFEMFRLLGDILEQRFDDEVHCCRWEPVD